MSNSGLINRSAFYFVFVLLPALSHCHLRYHIHSLLNCPWKPRSSEPEELVRWFTGPVYCMTLLQIDSKKSTVQAKASKPQPMPRTSSYIHQNQIACQIWNNGRHYVTKTREAAAAYLFARLFVPL